MAAGAEINIEVFGEKIVSRRLLRIGARAVDATPAFAEIAVLFYESEKTQFATEGQWASHGWVPDKQATVTEKIKHGFSTMTLQKTKEMMHSLTDPGSPHSHRDIGPDFVELTSTVPYGKFHQMGTSKMPMRKPVELNEPTKNLMVKLLQRWVLGGGGSDDDVVVRV